MSDTPRTNELLNQSSGVIQTVQGLTNLARDLERELARAMRVVEAARALDGHADTALALSVVIEEWEAGR